MREFMIINLRIYHQKCKLLICFVERREEGGGQDKEQSWPSYGGNKLIVSERRERERERERLFTTRLTSELRCSRPSPS